MEGLRRFPEFIEGTSTRNHGVHPCSPPKRWVSCRCSLNHLLNPWFGGFWVPARLGPGRCCKTPWPRMWGHPGSHDSQDQEEDHQWSWRTRLFGSSQEPVPQVFRVLGNRSLDTSVGTCARRVVGSCWMTFQSSRNGPRLQDLKTCFLELEGRTLRT